MTTAVHTHSSRRRAELGNALFSIQNSRTTTCRPYLKAWLLLLLPSTPTSSDTVVQIYLGFLPSTDLPNCYQLTMIALNFKYISSFLLWFSPVGTKSVTVRWKPFDFENPFHILSSMKRFASDIDLNTISEHPLLVVVLYIGRSHIMFNYLRRKGYSLIFRAEIIWFTLTCNLIS